MCHHHVPRSVCLRYRPYHTSATGNQTTRHDSVPIVDITVGQIAKSITALVGNELEGVLPDDHWSEPGEGHLLAWIGCQTMSSTAILWTSMKIP